MIADFYFNAETKRRKRRACKDDCRLSISSSSLEYKDENGELAKMTADFPRGRRRWRP